MILFRSTLPIKSVDTKTFRSFCFFFVCLIGFLLPNLQKCHQFVNTFSENCSSLFGLLTILSASTVFIALLVPHVGK
ncbi:GPI-anchored surface protein, putative [Bodo saltans]|uniref:GPI-anchored surface protein, putative n=1 Tax=Bodo saltans TaxID=75058 RepID=A0A0S4J6W3_BODSA|nr:GPI-anchored surface protein, putative [Bodo saltans]|eukprot:CUG85582.1 GPI-anchored surface protein, putative [Bodo saltans]